MTVSTQNLHISLGGTEILKGIDFHTKQNSFVGIIGPNGSGKSTLLQMYLSYLKTNVRRCFIGRCIFANTKLKAIGKKDSCSSAA